MFANRFAEAAEERERGRGQGQGQGQFLSPTSSSQGRRTPSSRRSSPRSSNPSLGSGGGGGDALASRVSFYMDDGVVCDDAPPRVHGAASGGRQRRAVSLRDPGRRRTPRLHRHASDVTPRARVGSVRRPRSAADAAPTSEPPPQPPSPKERRRRATVLLVGATFVFLLACSVLVVVVTLTHASFRADAPPSPAGANVSSTRLATTIGENFTSTISIT